MITNLNAFPHIFLLFRFQCQLNEQLLEFLVAIVDAKLFKTTGKKQC
jgi:hypothetical protein